MNDEDTAAQFIGDIPGNYDKYLGPNIFNHFARVLADRICAQAPSNVLEMAAGSGIVSRYIRDALPKDVPLTVTDLNQPMLDAAAQKFEQDETVDFQQADAQNLPFDDDQFDLVACQFGVMFFPDIVGSYAETARVIAPGGTYMFSTWGTNAENPFSQIAHNAIGTFFPEDPPGFYKVPFFYSDPSKVMADLAEAGLHNVRHEKLSHTRAVPDFDAFSRGLVYGNPVRMEIEARGGDIEAVREHVANELRAAFGKEPAEMPLLVNLFSVTI